MIRSKNVNTYLNFLYTTIKLVAFHALKPRGTPKDQNSLINIQKLHLQLCKQILGVEKSTSKLKVFVKLGKFLFWINTETQLFKYLQKIPCVKEDFFLRKAFNEEPANKEWGWVKEIRHQLDSYVCLTSYWIY